MIIFNKLDEGKEKNNTKITIDIEQQQKQNVI